MWKPIAVVGVLGASLLLLVAGEQGCTTSLSPDPLLCDRVEDCQRYEFPIQDCDPELGGAWACEGGFCLPLCFQCNDVEDCELVIWNGDPATCPSDKQYFECRERFCAPLCDTECDIPSDCNEKEWPSEATCQEDDGHWECGQGFCVTVCDGCAEASDCEAANPEFPKCCQGHWECVDTRCDAVCDEGCETGADCVGQQWPPLSECTEEQGRWECVGCECEAMCVSNCDDASDCLGLDWEKDCEGHWSCDAGWCTAHCGETCGDGACLSEDGETIQTCPADCASPCSDAEDCTDRAWGLPCQGRFECDEGDCLRVCDYSTCGVGGCQPVEGESERSCPDDCLDGCASPTDCLDEPWTQLGGGGSYSCISGECRQTVDPATCGNGLCDSTGFSAESGLSCAADCGAGPCETAFECNAYPWRVDCDGHWGCVDQNRCDPVCDSAACSDGTCDVLGGESPFNCAADCTAYQCLSDQSCNGLTLPAGCNGSYRCFERVCVPLCE